MTASKIFIPIWTNDICHLGVIRSLGMQNLPIHSLKITWPGMPQTFSQYSIFFSKHTDIGNPLADLKNSLKRAKSVYDRLKKDYRKIIFIPTSDTAQIFLEHLLDFLSLDPKSAYPTGKLGIYQNYSNKFYHEKLFAKLSSLDSLNTTIEDNIFPMILKPAKKDLGNSFSRLCGSKVKIINDYHDLETFKTDKPDLKNFIYQKIVNWHDYDERPHYFFFSTGDLKFSIAVEKKLIYPSPFGTSYFLNFENPNEKILEIAKDIGRNLKWNGPLMIEFAIGKSTKPTIIEMNTRPWLLNESFRQVGYDFITGNFQDRVSRNLSNLSAIWIRGLCALIQAGLSPKMIIEQTFESIGCRKILDADFLVQDPIPFEQSIKYYQTDSKCSGFIDEILSIL